MTNNNGLSNEEVIVNRKKYGSNTFSKKKQDSFFKLLMETFSDPIIKILLIALGIKTIFLIRDFDWYETVGKVIAILVASLISSKVSLSPSITIALKTPNSEHTCKVRDM